MKLHGLSSRGRSSRKNGFLFGFAALFLAAVFTFTFVACAPEEEKDEDTSWLIGTWTHVTSPTTVLTLNNDKTWENTTTSGSSWEVKDGVIKLENATVTITLDFTKTSDTQLEITAAFPSNVMIPGVYTK